MVSFKTLNMKRFLMVFLLFALNFSCIQYDSGKEFSKSNSYKGIIVGKYIRPHSDGMRAFAIKAGTIEFEEIVDFYPKLWEDGKVGDSIIKPADTLMIIVKNKDRKYQEFFYKF
jgi:hypothetical protein